MTHDKISAICGILLWGEFTWKVRNDERKEVRVPNVRRMPDQDEERTIYKDLTDGGWFISVSKLMNWIWIWRSNGDRITHPLFKSKRVSRYTDLLHGAFLKCEGRFCFHSIFLLLELVGWPTHLAFDEGGGSREHERTKKHSNKQ